MKKIAFAGFRHGHIFQLYNQVKECDAIELTGCWEEDEAARKVAMQATAMAPLSIDENDCPAEVVEKEKAIQMEMMKQDPKNANKPDAILEKIAEGKMRKFFEENTLLNQAVVGEKESIREFIKGVDAEATVVAYKRFALEA